MYFVKKKIIKNQSKKSIGIPQKDFSSVEPIPGTPRNSIHCKLKIYESIIKGDPDNLILIPVFCQMSIMDQACHRFLWFTAKSPPVQSMHIRSLLPVEFL